MGVQQFVKNAFKQSLSTFDAEEITIKGQIVRAVLDDTQRSNAAGRGATNNERTLTVTFPPDAITHRPRSGDYIQARGEKWQISSESGSIRIGQAAITLILVEPEHRNEF